MTKPEPSETLPRRQFELSEGESHSTAPGHETVSCISAGSDSASLDVRVSDSPASPIEASSRYEFRSTLGSGAYGTVSLAWDHQLKREVAIKRPRAKLADSAREMFLHEAQLAAKVRHPAVVVVHDVQIDDQGVPFIVYEYLPGKSLREQLKTNEPMLVATALEFAIAIAEGLAAAHKLGLTHRDLKPANILLDENGRPRIADFGLAIEEGRQLGLRGEFAGTHKFMSPEQVRGEAHHLDGRTDLWALGIILYQMLTGRHPFPGEIREELSDQILNRAPRPPRQWVGEIPKAVENIVLKLLAKPVGERYASAGEVVEELTREYLIVCPLSDRGDAPKSEIFKGRRWSQVMLAPLGVMLAAVMFLAAHSLWVPDTSQALNGIWVPLLQAEPAPITPLGNETQMIFDERKRTLFLDTEYPKLLQIGETVADSYSIRITVKPETWDDNSGVFWGLSADGQDPDAELASVANVFKSTNGDLGLQLRRMKIQRNKLQLPADFDRPHVSSCLIKATSRLDSTIQLDIKNNSLIAAFVNDQLVFREEELAQLATNPIKGRIGVFAFGCRCTFANAEIRTLE